ncbi:MAG: hypothetical protein AAGU11_13465 [Syntrophobacteraceae bacterium]
MTCFLQQGTRRRIGGWQKFTHIVWNARQFFPKLCRALILDPAIQPAYGPNLDILIRSYKET